MDNPGYNPVGTDWTRPPQFGFDITPGAGALEHVIRCVNLATSGNVTFTLWPSGDSVELYLVAGMQHPVVASHVTAATATGIKGLY